MVISSPMIPNCPADDTCATTKVISALLTLDRTWSTVVKIATKPALLAGVPVEEQVGRLNSLQTSSRANKLGIPRIVGAGWTSRTLASSDGLTSRTSTFLRDGSGDIPAP
jgi:hypothetical protein